jgi:hypothetical protein
MLNKLLEKFFIKEEREYVDLYVSKSNNDNHIAISKVDDYIEFRFLNTNLELYKHYLYPTFWLKCVNELRKKFFYEEHILDFKEDDPLYIYLYRLCPYIYIHIIQEDRRPDLNKEEAQSSLGYKFKTQIFVRFLLLEYSFILHSLSTGFVHKYDYSKIGTIIRSINKYGWINTNLISTDLNSDFSDRY